MVKPSSQGNCYSASLKTLVNMFLYVDKNDAWRNSFVCRSILCILVNTQICLPIIRTVGSFDDSCSVYFHLHTYNIVNELNFFLKNVVDVIYRISVAAVFLKREPLYYNISVLLV